MRNKLIIVGTGLLGEVAQAYFEKYTHYRVAAFACHARLKTSESAFNRPLHELENLPDVCSPEDHDVFVAIGYRKMNQIRQAAYEEVKQHGYTCATFVHPDVMIWESTRLGDNTFILENNTVQPFTEIGANTFLWSGNHIGHHSKIGSHCFISSHVVISGYCEIGNNVFIGVNSTLRDGLKVADKTLIGAGALMMKDTAYQEAYIPPRCKPCSRSSEELDF